MTHRVAVVVVVVVSCFTWSLAGCTNTSKSDNPLYSAYGNYDPLVENPPLLAPQVSATPVSRAPGDRDLADKIVQFQGPIDEDIQIALRRERVRVLGYIPDYALLVQATASQLDVLSGWPQVRAITDQLPAFKLDRRLMLKTSKGYVFPRSATTHPYVVELIDARVRAAVTQLIYKLGGDVERPHETDLRVATQDHTLAIRLPPRALAQLASHVDVRFIAPRARHKLLNDRSYGIVQAGKRNVSPIWNKGLLGAGQIIALCDSGVDTDTCYFQDDKIVDYQDLTVNPDGDGDGHGTHVAGSIAGDKFNNHAYDTHDGMAPAARLVVQDIAEGSELTGLADDLTDLFASAYDQGARIHSNSWGDDDPTYSLSARTADAFIHTHRNFLVLFAAGNSGSSQGTVGAPATAKNLITVGALYASAPEDVAFFSSHGPTEDDRIKPTLLAPGVGVVSARRASECSTTSKTGTSMATPILAGAAALARQYFTDGFYPSGVPTPKDGLEPSAALLRAVLIAGAQDMTGDETGGHIPAHGQGFGRASLTHALPFGDADERLWVRDEGTGLQTRDKETFEIQKSHEGPLKVVLTWTDPPAEEGVGKALVNDLDLVVRGPHGTYRGNAMADGVAITDGKGDRRNVEEIVFLPNAEPGAWRITVRGHHVPMGPQNFALAVLGSPNSGHQ